MSWELDSQLTSGSEYNHTYVRRPVDAHEEGRWERSIKTWIAEGAQNN